jgi:cephalosporin hydroxylase
MTIEDEYQALLREDSDIVAHLPLLRELASRCCYVVELGVRTGRSTTALLAGAKEVHSWDIDPCRAAREKLEPLAEGRWYFHQGDSVGALIPECDLLFIDTEHTYLQLRAELYIHHARVNQFIAMHDTWMWEFPQYSEGMRRAIDEFLEDFPEWTMYCEDKECNGMTVLKRVR